MNVLVQDLRYAFRLLRQSPVLTAVVLMTVALGIGANTAVFAVVEAALLRPLPYAGADRIVVASDMAPGEIMDWRARSRSFSAMAAVRDGAFDLTNNGDRPQRLAGLTADWRFFDVMNVRPSLGRVFTAEDEQARRRVVVLSDSLWRTRFGADPSLLGRTLVLSGDAYTVIGVMPAGFERPLETQLWVPPTHAVPDHPLRPGVDMTLDYGSHYLAAYARLGAGVSLRAAQSEQRTLFLRMMQEHPREMIPDDVNVAIVPLREWLVGDVTPALLVLLAVVALVLLIACANIANLLLARATARGREIGVRAALGATRIRLARQLLTESIVLAVCGGGLGVLAAAWVLPTILALAPSEVAAVQPSLGVPVLFFGVAVSIVTGIVFGCVPALQASRGGLAATLHGTGRSTEGPQSTRLRDGLIVAECAVSVMLLVLAGLLIRSFDSLVRVNPGFDPANRQVARIVLPAQRYSAPEAQVRFFRDVLDRVRSAPGVTGAALAARLPFVEGNSTRGIVIDHQTTGNPAAGIRVVSAGYFEVLGQPLVSGRGFTDRDRSGAPLVAVVNQTMAKAYWPGSNAIGHRFRIGTEPWIEIVGVAADVKHGSLRESIAPEFYQPFEQAPWSFMAVVIDTRLAPTAVSSMLDGVLGTLDPALPTPAVRPMAQLIRGSVAMDRFEMVGLAVFAAVGLSLAIVGLFGVMSYVVSRRTREMGLRIALGATPGSIVTLVMGDGLRLAAVGLALGLGGSLAAARAIRSWLFGVSAYDPLTLIFVAVVLAATAALACYVPARRAMSVDPMRALRVD